MKAMKMTIITTVLVIMINVSSHAGMFCNDVVGAFNDLGDGRNQQIEEFVVLGAKLFIGSYKDAMAMINEFEIELNQQINVSYALVYTENSLKLIQDSKNKYIAAKESGEKIGYNPENQEKFKEFDYDGFINTNRLNTIIGTKVKLFFKKGDILGAYQEIIDNIDDIERVLITIRDILKVGSTPSKDILWDLIQQYSNTMLFGNYMTRFGISILE